MRARRKVTERKEERGNRDIHVIKAFSLEKQFSAVVWESYTKNMLETFWSDGQTAGRFTALFFVIFSSCSSSSFIQSFSENEGLKESDALYASSGSESGFVFLLLEAFFPLQNKWNLSRMDKDYLSSDESLKRTSGAKALQQTKLGIPLDVVGRPNRWTKPNKSPTILTLPSTPPVSSASWYFHSKT